MHSGKPTCWAMRGRRALLRLLQRELLGALIAGAILWIDKLNSARRRLLKRHTDIRNSLPSDAAFSQRKAGVEGKVEFGRKVRSAWKLQAGTVIAR